MVMKETKDMDCIATNPLNDGDLLRFLDGEAPQEIGKHLENCLYCQGRADALQSLQSDLTSDLFRSQCPSSQELGDYHLQLLPVESWQIIDSHVAECSPCSRELAQLDNYLNQVGPELETRAVERVKIFVAKLLGSLEGSHPAASAPALVGVRGTESSAQMYEAGEMQLSIEIQKDPEHPGKATLLGLVLSAEPETYLARLFQDGQEKASSILDDLGNFVFADLSTGPYDLILQGPENEIHIPNIDV